MSDFPVLYSFRRCPYAMRARLALLHCGCSVELREVVLRDKPEQLLQASAKGTVPVLVLSDGEVVDESMDIMLWAVASNPASGLLNKQRQQQLDLIAAVDKEFKPLLDNYKYFQRQPQLTQLQHRQKAVNWLMLLEQRLATRRYLMGDVMDFADLAIFPFVRQFAHVDRAWFYGSELQHCQRWLQACIDTELFEATMKKQLPWKQGMPISYFG